MRISASSSRFTLAVSLFALVLGISAPAAGATIGFTKLGAELTTERYEPAAATLPGGNVLIAGGDNQPEEALASAELFKPTTDSIEKLSAVMTIPRDEDAYVALPSGKVLIVGGTNQGEHELDSAELFNPATNAFEPLTGRPRTARDGGAAALLHNGTVLIIGGTTENTELRVAEIFHPETGNFEALSSEMSTERYEPVAATLPSGEVLIAGGSGGGAGALQSAEVFNPATGRFEALAATTRVAHEEQAYVALQDGDVLIAGGDGTAGPLESAELFAPGSAAFESVGSLATERDGDAAALLPDGHAVVVGGVGTHSAALALEETTIAPPAASTAAASALTASTATLGGAVMSEVIGASYFQYGTSTAYGASTAHAAIAAALASAATTAAVSGLAPYTTYHFRLVAENAGGTTYGADQAFTTSQRPPVLTGLKESPSRWRTGSKAASISRRHSKPRRKPPVGTTFSFSLTEQSTVTMSFSRQISGHMAGHRCATGKSRRRHARKCKTSVGAGSMTRTALAGSDNLSFQGIVSKGHKLKPGNYTVTITATDYSGQSSPASIAFTIVK